MNASSNCLTCSTDVILGEIASMHMRPVSRFVKISRQFESEVFIEYMDKKANGKSLLDIITLGIPGGARFSISAIGSDASKAIRVIKNFFKRLLCDEIKDVVIFDDHLSSYVNPEQNINVKKEIEMKEVKASKEKQKKTASKKCAASKCSSVCETKQKSKKTQKFAWPVENETREVFLAGDFNSWNPEPMTRLEEEFQALMELEPGEYQYKFIVNGQWIPDPNARKVEPNVFGSVNSVVIVG